MLMGAWSEGRVIDWLTLKCVMAGRELGVTKHTSSSEIHRRRLRKVSALWKVLFGSARLFSSSRGARAPVTWRAFMLGLVIGSGDGS